MSTSRSGASYLGPNETHARASTRARYSLPLSVILGLLASVLLLALMPFVETHSKTGPVDALTFRVFCQDKLGHQMDQGPWTAVIKSDYAAEEASRRRLTAQEAFGSNLWFSGYQGETKDGDNDGFTTETDRPDAPFPKLLEDNNDSDEAVERVYDTRSMGTCIRNMTEAPLANGVLAFAKGMTILVTSFTSLAFSSGIICEEAGAASNDNCVDLLFIIGGDGSSTDKGLIGNLTDSIYLPLLVLMSLLVAVSIFWKGIVKRQLRDALWSIIWACLAVIVGLALLLNPAMLAKAPASFSNTMAGCIIASFGGENCLGDQVGDLNSPGESSEVCVASARGVGANEARMELLTSSLTCSVWKAFVLEPYSHATWGTNFTNLDTRGDTSGARLVRNAGADPQDFCVNMGTSTPLEDQLDGKLNLDTGPAICNLALYQLFISTEADSGGEGADYIKSGSTQVDARWYKLVDVAATSETTWNYWAGGGGSGTDRVAAAFISLVSSVLGGVVLLIIAVFAMVFYFISIFLMALAPLFFLIGVHPGKGRDILKGYGEMVLSNIFKYIASALFLVLSLALYAGVLGASSSPDVTLLLVVILSLALLLYRKEIVDLVGTVNMGGTKMGQATTDRIKRSMGDKGRDVRRLASTTATTGLGVKLAGGSVKTGMAEGFSRELKRPGGLLGAAGAGVSRGYDLAGADNKSKLLAEKGDLEKASRAASSEVTEKTEKFESNKEEFNKLADEFKAHTDKLEELRNALENDSSQDAVLERMKNGQGLPAILAGDGGKFAEAMVMDQKATGFAQRLRDEPQSPDADQWRADQKQAEDRRNQLVQEMDRNGTYNGLQSHFDTEHNSAVRDFNATLAARNATGVSLETAREGMESSMVEAVDASMKSKVAESELQGFSDALGGIRTNKAINAEDMENVRSAGAAHRDAATETTTRGTEIANLNKGVAKVESKDSTYRPLATQSIEKVILEEDDPLPGMGLPIPGRTRPEAKPQADKPKEKPAPNHSRTTERYAEDDDFTLPGLPTNFNGPVPKRPKPTDEQDDEA